MFCCFQITQTHCRDTQNKLKSVTPKKNACTMRFSTCLGFVSSPPTKGCHAEENSRGKGKKPTAWPRTPLSSCAPSASLCDHTLYSPLDHPPLTFCLILFSSLPTKFQPEAEEAASFSRSAHNPCLIASFHWPHLRALALLSSSKFCAWPKGIQTPASLFT